MLLDETAMANDSPEPSTHQQDRQHTEYSKECLPYTFRDLTPELIERARIELKEVDESRGLALAKLRNLIKTDSKLTSYEDDEFLLQFLRARKFDVKRAFELLQRFWKFRKDYRHILDEAQLDPVKVLLLKSYVGLLHSRDRSGSVVIILKMGQWDPDEDRFELLFRTAVGILLSSIRNPVTQVAGYRFILDLRDITWKQLMMCTPANIMLLTRSPLKSFPARYKGIHVITESKFLNFVWTSIASFVTAKMKTRLSVHSNDMSQLREVIHPSVLPVEYGGEAGPFENSKWGDIIDSESGYVLDMLNYGYKS